MDWLTKLEFHQNLETKPRFLQKDRSFLLQMMKLQGFYTDPDKVRRFGASIGR